MKHLISAVLAFCTLLAPGVIRAQGGAPVYQWDQAHHHIGEKAIVEGKIVDSHNTGKVCYLNFHSDYELYTTVVIFADDFGKFPSPPEKFYLNKSIRVSGEISQYRDRPQIIIEGPDQITVVGAAAAAPSAAVVPPRPASPVAPPSSAPPVVSRPAVAPNAPPSSAPPVVSRPAPASFVPARPAEPVVPRPVAASPSASGLPVVDWREARKYMGTEVVVEGKIVGARNIGSVCYLNFDPDYRTYVSGVILSESFGEFAGAPETIFINKHVRITGRVSDRDGRPQIIISSASQIEIIAAGASSVAAAASEAAEAGHEDSGSAPRTSGASDFDALEVAWAGAGLYTGQTISTQGRIAHVYDSGTAIFLSFDKDYRNNISAFIPASSRALFPGRPKDRFSGKLVRLVGEVEDYQGTSRITVLSSNQLVVLD